MTVEANVVKRSATAPQTASRVDWLRPWEHLFLLFVVVVGSYALTQLPLLQSLSWYFLYLCALAFFLLHYGAFLQGLWFGLPLLLWPLLAGLSFFWSDLPGQSLRSAIQLTMTVLISLYLGLRFSLFDMTRALFVVLTATALLSLAAILLNVGFAFDLHGVPQGIFPHKNVLGGRMVLLALCALLLFAAGWHRLLTTAAALLALALVALSQSGTSILMTAGLCGLAPVLLSRHAAAPLRLIAYLVALLILSVIAWALLAYEKDPIDLALETLGKERTLTGRSLLWDFALTQVEARPLFGGGFDAFWNSGAGSQGSYLQHVLGSAVKNFHNSYLDISVQLGFAGLLATAAVLLHFAVRALTRAARDTLPLAALPLLFLAFVSVYSISEYALFRQHDLIQVLLGALYVSAALAPPAAEAARRQASPSNWPAT
jgi:O-antigen ligase